MNVEKLHKGVMRCLKKQEEIFETKLKASVI